MNLAEDDLDPVDGDLVGPERHDELTGGGACTGIGSIRRVASWASPMSSAGAAAQTGGGRREVPVA
jgi:hypothetical protein